VSRCEGGLELGDRPSFTTTASPSKIARSTGMSNARAIAEKRLVQSSPLRV
jgi:hypothetical protein